MDSCLMPLAGCAYALWEAVAALPALAGVVCFPTRILSVSRGRFCPLVLIGSHLAWALRLLPGV